MPVLMGTYQNSIDAKNRFSVPAKFRDELGAHCILTKGIDNCLEIYPMSTWNAQQAEIAKLPRADEMARAYRRYTYANAVECDFDKQGRAVIPQFLREMVGIEKDLVTIGMLDRIEVWSREVYENDELGGKLSSNAFSELSEKYDHRV